MVTLPQTGNPGRRRLLKSIRVKGTTPHAPYLRPSTRRPFSHQLLPWLFAASEMLSSMRLTCQKPRDPGHEPVTIWRQWVATLHGVESISLFWGEPARASSWSLGSMTYTPDPMQVQRPETSIMKLLNWVNRVKPLPRQAKCRTLVNYSAKDMSLSASGLVSSPTQDMLRQDCWLASTELLIRHTRNPTRSR